MKHWLVFVQKFMSQLFDYTFKYQGETHNIDLSKIKDKVIDESVIKEGKNEFEFILPTAKIPVTFKLLTHKDERNIDRELKGLQKINKKDVKDLTTRLKHILLSVDGDYDTKTIREFVDTKFLARDARELRNYIGKIQPSVDLTFDLEDAMGNIKSTEVPIGIEFFWPDAELQEFIIRSDPRLSVPWRRWIHTLRSL